MSDDPHGTHNIPIGAPVRAYNGSLLGYVREVHPHYLLVGRRASTRTSKRRSMPSAAS